ncbi:KTSC domain-containing protein [Pedobacter yulinensis]|uniref:KTSC domain-containing protein n=1 Tax=Pedobacter yulinensis TaxID=2126353 RepID=A0A2T3HJJ4_9SPHI|nr:KTSC domain-containing protein [Pedobacter yulinensis]PST82589.1 KTSC domain-containing protein [Pedobacter yulinensis]
MPSTVIQHMHYDPASCDLEIGYTTGQRYRYKGVPEKVYKELRASVVKGRYLRHHIIGIYEYEKMG